MKKISILSIALALCLFLCCACGGSSPAPAPAEPTEAPAEPAPEKEYFPQDNLGYALGMTMPDFSFTTFDGREMSLYASLAEKELVVINLWATWCGPCGMEFPYMEEAYQQYADSVEIFALSCEASDSDEKLAEYVSEMGMSFPVGRDSNNLAAAFNAYSIPTTVLVDRFGTICAVEVGAKTSVQAFAELFEAFTGDDYSGYTAPEPEPALICDVEPSSGEELAAALNPDGGIVFSSIDNDYIWPFLVEQRGESTIAVSSNAGLDSTVSAILADFEAEAGQVLRLDFSLSCEEAGDIMCIYLDDSLIKCFGGEKGPMSYAFTIEKAGSHQLVITYSKDSFGTAGDDILILESLQLLSGSDGNRALESNPIYPIADEISLHPANYDARQVFLDDPMHLLIDEESAPLFSFWIVPGGEADMLLQLTEAEDPERYVFLSDYDSSYATAIRGINRDGYAFLSHVADMNADAYPFTTVYVQDMALSSLFRAAVCFRDVESLEYFLDQLVDEDGNHLVTWSYAEKVGLSDVDYTVFFTDGEGGGVPGVMLQVCDESMCQVFTSDENGRCSFTLPPYPYELHILSLPEGWSAESDSAVAPAEGGMLSFVLSKE